MAKLKIITGADNPVLRAKSESVKKFDNGLKKFFKEMREAMILANGVGIAAPQVGQNIRAFVVVLDLKKKSEKTLNIVNPEIIEVSEEQTIEEEGCLSLPGVYGKVPRPKKIKVSFFDAEGTRQALKLENMNARVFLHEFDHIEGVLFLDKMVTEEES